VHADVRTSSPAGAAGRVLATENWHGWSDGCACTCARQVGSTQSLSLLASSTFWLRSPPAAPTRKRRATLAET